jgi:hypothetical protein
MLSRESVSQLTDKINRSQSAEKLANNKAIELQADKD